MNTLHEHRVSRVRLLRIVMGLSVQFVWHCIFSWDELSLEPSQC